MDDYEKNDCEKECHNLLPFLAKQHIETNNSRSKYFSNESEMERYKKLIENENIIWGAIADTLDKNDPKLRQLTETGKKLAESIIKKIKQEEEKTIAKAVQTLTGEEKDYYIFAERQAKFRLLSTRALRLDKQLTESIKKVLKKDYDEIANILENAWNNRRIEQEKQAKMQQKNSSTAVREIKTEQQKHLEKENNILTSINENFPVKKPATAVGHQTQLLFSKKKTKRKSKKTSQNNKKKNTYNIYI